MEGGQRLSRAEEAKTLVPTEIKEQPLRMSQESEAPDVTPGASEVWAQRQRDGRYDSAPLQTPPERAEVCAPETLNQRLWAERAQM